jgi:two-component system, chemotaxis family, response regulator Rcp1
VRQTLQTRRIPTLPSLPIPWTKGELLLVLNRQGVTSTHILKQQNFLKKQSSQASMPREVLLVEDSAGDVRLTQEALHAVNLAVRLHVASDGVEAMALLTREEVHAHVPRPALILLDLNMPRMAGREVLARIKKDDRLKTIPIVILPTSASEADIMKSYQLHANSYLCKPAQFAEFEKLVKSINDFWLTTARLPRLSG